MSNVPVLTCLRQIAKSRLLILRTLGIIEFWSNTNNRASGNRKKSLMGIWKRLSVNHPSNHRVVLFAYIPFSSVSLFSSLLFSSLSLSFSLPFSILLRLFFLGRVSPLLSTPPWSFLGGSTVLHLRRRYIPPCPLWCIRVHEFWRINLYIHTHTYAHIGGDTRCCEEDTYVHPDWRFSYLIVDCHAKARTSYWLGVLLLHPLVLGARVCLSILERRGNKRGESHVRAHDCVRVRRRARRKRDEKNAGTNLGTVRMEMPCRCYSHLHSDFRYKPLFLRLLYIYIYIHIYISQLTALPSSCFSLLVFRGSSWRPFQPTIGIRSWNLRNHISRASSIIVKIACAL